MRLTHWVGLATAALGMACDGATPPSEPGGGVDLRIQTVAGARILDAGRVHLVGPTPKTLDVTPGQQVNITDLSPGTYSLALEGLISDELYLFGKTSNVRVAADSTSQVTVTLSSFVSAITSIPALSGSKTFTVGYSAVANAVNYQVETATDARFFNNRDSVATSQISRSVTVPADGAYYVRVRAVDEYGTRGLPSGVDSIRVQGCSDCWLSQQPLLTARENLAVGVVKDVVYAIGGDLLLNDQNTVEVYDPVGTGQWATVAHMPTARTGLAVGVTGLTSPLLYAVGGSRSFTSLNTVEVYDPRANIWNPAKSMNTPRSGLGVGVIKDIVYAVGGDAGRTVEAYDPSLDTWVFKKAMGRPRSFFAVAVLNGLLYTIGGRDSAGGELGTVEAYDPDADTWTARAPMPTPRAFLTAAAVNGRIYAIGGQTFAAGELATVEAYDPLSNTWTTKKSIDGSRGFLGAAVAGGLIYAAGGSFMDGELNTFEVYEP
jgi:Kelch motif